MTTAVNLVMLALAVPAILCVAYLLLLTLLSGRPAAMPRSTRRLTFDIVVPAHNEAVAITAVVRNLLQIDWPREGLRVLVVADNCDDSTAALARTAGATVLERHDPERRGKGHALSMAFAASRAHGWAQAVVVVDADTQVSPNLLECFAARIERGATALQAHYDVLNPHDSWRTRLMAIAMTCFHRVRSRGRERLALSCGIRGNGWCVTHALLSQTPCQAYSLAEDIEFGIALGLAGARVHYVDEARVAAAMVSGEQAARSQRQRWEAGKWQLTRSMTLPLLRAAWTRRSTVCADLAADLLVPPLAYVALDVFILLMIAGLAATQMPGMLPWLWIALGCALGLSLHVLRGWQLSGIGLRGLLDLARVPAFVAWKLALMLGASGPTEWIRTRREQR